MSKTTNALDFQRKFRLARHNYNNNFKIIINKIKDNASDNLSKKIPPDIDEALEAHIRIYIINELLNALNWRFNYTPSQGLPDLSLIIPEAQIESIERGTTRFLDYLGLERSCDKPLLVIEAKRPTTTLPKLRHNNIERDYSSIICQGLIGKELVKKEWNEWLNTLRDYICSIKKRYEFVPKRVVLTNGDWLVIFLDPEDAFVISAIPEPSKILVFENEADIDRHYNELYLHLEFSHICEDLPGLSIGVLPFYIDLNEIVYAMYGIRLIYSEKPPVYEGPSPIIRIAPVIFLGSVYKTWIAVEYGSDKFLYELPHNDKDLPKHLEDIKKCAGNLLKQIQERCSKNLKILPLSEHYIKQEYLNNLKGCREFLHDHSYLSFHYLIVTGMNTHYILPEISIQNCPYHKWENCEQEGFQVPNPIKKRTTSEPRSFFISEELHHCAHKEVFNMKKSNLGRENRIRCGSRSGKDGDPFCELFSIDELLCCRTCIFEEVCSEADVFRLPCKTGSDE